MKKLILASILGFSLFSAKADLISTVTLTGGTLTNIPTAVSNAPFRLTSLTISAGGTSVTNVTFYDTPTNALTYTIPAYTNIQRIATNYVTTWTNYFTAVTSTTNLALVTITNGYASSTGNYRLIFGASALANTTTYIDTPAVNVVYGLWATNPVSDGTATITITYQQ